MNMEDSLKHLLRIHFPGSRVRGEGELAQSGRGRGAAARGSLNERALLREIVTADRVKWAIRSFEPFKAPGIDKIYPVILQRGLEQILDRLVRLFRACLRLAYVPASWQQVRVVFIPKPGRPAYDQAKAFRPISLTSFLLKALERLVDRYLRDGPLSRMPLHKNQHAYLAGKSTESTLHCLVSRIEKAISHKQYALGAFMDIEGAFDNASFDSIQRALEAKGVSPLVTGWIACMLRTRRVRASAGDSSVEVEVSQGCPQGGVLSPLLWCLVVDSLLEKLNEARYYCQFYSDDGAIVIVGQFLEVVCQVMNSAFRILEEWCGENGLSVAPQKLELVLFTHRRKLDGFKAPRLFGTPLELKTEVKVLGVILDSKLSWRQHVTGKCRKAVCAWGQARRAIGGAWGLRPSVVSWLYTAVIRPMLTYAAAIWWERVLWPTVRGRLLRIQRMVCLSITGAMRSTPTAALQVLLGLPPLDIYIQGLAMATSYRLANSGVWRGSRNMERGHARILELARERVPCL